MTFPIPCKSLLCKAVSSASGPAAETLAPGSVSSPGKMKMVVTVTDEQIRRARFGISQVFFFYQRVTEAGLALATLDPEDLRYVFLIHHVRISV